MAVKEALNKFEAGQLIRSRREALGYTQTDVVEHTTITVETYVSELENGKVSVGRSKHFPSLALYLKLSEKDIRAISPGAVFELSPAAAEPHLTKQPLAEDIPTGLLEAAEKYGSKFPALRKHRVQEQLASARFFDGIGPETAEEWRDYYTSVSRWISDKD